MADLADNGSWDTWAVLAAIGAGTAEWSALRCLKRGCDAAILTVERLTDHATGRLRIVCVAGHSGFVPADEPAPGRPVERKQPALGICGECLKPLDQPTGTDRRHHRYFHADPCATTRQRRRMRERQREIRSRA